MVVLPDSMYDGDPCTALCNGFRLLQADKLRESLRKTPKQMNFLLKLLKKNNLTPDQVSQGMGMPFRTLDYNFKTGSVPYSMIYQLHLVTGVPLSEIVPKHLAEEWLKLFTEKRKGNKPRGKTEPWQWKNKKSKWSKNLELDEPVAGQDPKEKLHVEPETTTFPINEENQRIASPVAPIPKSVTPPILKSVTPKKKASIADLMKANPPAPPASGEPEPDFSGLDDSVFSTSMDAANNPLRKKR